MKIGLTGAHGTGKTTLAQALTKKLNIPYIQEIARTQIRLLEKYKVNYQELQGYKADLFQNSILINQLLLESVLPGFLSDRTVIDVRAYCSVESSLYIPIDPERYDYVIYVPIEFELPQDDPQRYLDPNFQVHIDKRISNLIKKYIPEDKIIRVSGSLENRVSQVLRKL